MDFQISVRLDRDEHNQPRIIRAASKTYRFSIAVKFNDGEEAMEVEGFRIEANLRRIIPPTTVGKHQAYTVAWLTPRLEAIIIDQLKREINAQG